jgi:hypothetical protein
MYSINYLFIIINKFFLYSKMGGGGSRTVYVDQIIQIKADPKLF